ncbi:MAG: hypothetical protein JWN14_2449, partial [Chthonomonadales bacterium]|nr:hypothetical protein [Chthonomonadales bacterium]
IGMITGDIYQLLDDLGDISAGLWVVVEVGMMITLSRLGENEDGDLCTTHRLVKVTRDELQQFVWMEVAVELLG